MKSDREMPTPRPPTSGRIRELSTERGVSMGGEWFDLATPNHFWMARRFEVLRKLCGQRFEGQPRCGEVGCGNGILQAQIEAAYGCAVDGFDLHRGALERNVSSRGQLHYYDVTERRPEFRHRYDVLLAFDVIEHIERQAEFIEACRFHLQPSGAILVNVPARAELFSRYDLAAGHVRRYSMHDLEALADRVGMRVAERSYWGLPLYPLLWVRKLMLRRAPEAKVLRAGFHSRSAAMNKLLHGLARCEPIPQCTLGTSILAVFENVNQ